MTSVVWDGETLAADRQITDGRQIAGQCVKIRRCQDGRLIGGCGDLGFLATVLDWLDEGQEEERPVWPSTSDEAIEILPNGQVWLHLKHGRAQMMPGPAAIGSGTPYALAAMACGQDAVGAVKIAAKFDTGTGGRIDSLPLKEAAPKPAPNAARRQPGEAGVLGRRVSSPKIQKKKA